MKRTQVQLDEAMYHLLRRKAFEQGVSVAALLREALQEYLGLATSRRPRLEEFRFIGSGQSAQGDLAPVSERHDKALAKGFDR
ncbi:MAG: CopG family transcriptional regulator [Chloroflexi bacterium]|nr:CopG family transcriptional regulator [Chloroflexota bacterium]